MGDLEAITIDYANRVLVAKRGLPALSGSAVRSAGPGPAGFELDSGNLLTIIAEFESLFELKRHS